MSRIESTDARRRVLCGISRLRTQVLVQAGCFGLRRSHDENEDNMCVGVKGIQTILELECRCRVSLQPGTHHGGKSSRLTLRRPAASAGRRIGAQRKIAPVKERLCTLSRIA